MLKNLEKIIKEERVPSLLLKILKKSTDADLVLRQIAVSIGQISIGDPETQKYFIDNGVATTYLDILRTAQHDTQRERVCEAFLKSLGKLIRGNESLQVIVADSGGIGSLLMLLNNKSAVVKSGALDFISDLCFQNKKNSIYGK